MTDIYTTRQNKQEYLICAACFENVFDILAKKTLFCSFITFLWNKNMQEIEIKIIDIKRPELLKKLTELGAEKHFDGELYATFWDTDDSFMRHEKQSLRLRKEGNVTRLTFKTPTTMPHERVKIMKELEVTVSDYETMEQMLFYLNYCRTRIVRKTREEYVLEGVKIMFDQYLDELCYIPLFMEIEAPDIESLHKVVALLGYGERDCLNWSMYELMDHFRYNR